MSRYVAKHLEPRQKEWNTATQNRIAATSSVISSMKSVKMLGLQERLNRRIQELRSEELWIASRLRWIVVWNNASGTRPVNYIEERSIMTDLDNSQCTRYLLPSYNTGPLCCIIRGS